MGRQHRRRCGRRWDSRRRRRRWCRGLWRRGLHRFWRRGRRGLWRRGNCRGLWRRGCRRRLRRIHHRFRRRFSRKGHGRRRRLRFGRLDRSTDVAQTEARVRHRLRGLWVLHLLAQVHTARAVLDWLRGLLALARTPTQAEETAALGRGCRAVTRDTCLFLEHFVPRLSGSAEQMRCRGIDHLGDGINPRSAA